jgi:hypothetical protein
MRMAPEAKEKRNSFKVPGFINGYQNLLGFACVLNVIPKTYTN